MGNRLIFLLGMVFFAQNIIGQNDFSTYINWKMNGYLRSNLQEKIYVQTNSNEYLPGDTIWFRYFHA